MSRAASHSETALPTEFEKYLNEALRDSQVRAGYDDSRALNALIDELIAIRKHLGMSQTAVAGRMGVKQPTVSGFENEGSDPRLSTLQRFARAVDSQIEFRVTPSTCVDFRPNSARYEARSNVRTSVSPHAVSTDGRFRLDLSDEYVDATRDTFALAS